MKLVTNEVPVVNPNRLIPRPVEDWVVVVQEKDLTSLIQDPNDFRVRVFDAGPGRTLESGARAPMPCRKGDLIKFDGQANGFLVDGVRYFLIPGRVVTCVLEPAPVEPSKVALS
jgi:hypothetical protein